MSDGKDIESGTDTAKGRLSLRPAGRLELGRTVDAGSVKQSFSHGRTKTVQVEVRKSRPGAAVPGRPTAPVTAPGRPAAAPTAAPAAVVTAPAAQPVAAASTGTTTTARATTPQAGAAARPAGGAARSPAGGRALTQSELATRQRVLAEQVKESPAVTPNVGSRRLS